MTNQEQKEEALRFVRSYKGDFQFLLAMQEKAYDPDWTPTIGQAQAILRCRPHPRFKPPFTREQSRGRVGFVTGRGR